MAQKRPGPRPSAAAAAAAAASQKRRHQERGAVHGDGHASGSVTSSSATAAASSVTVTHLYASSIAVPARSSLDALETQLLEKAEYIGPLLQRDVVMQRMDDLDEARMALEQADSSFGPMRRARVQSRLQMRLEDGKAEMRMYSQAQQRAPGAASTTGNTVGGGSGSASGATGAQAGAGAGAGVGVSSGSSQSNNAVASSQTGAASRVPDYVRVKNLTCSALQGDADACSGQRAVQTEARAGEGAETRPVSASIDPGQGFWKQATAVLGWIPHHTIVRQGRRFVLRHEEDHKTEALLFQLYKLDESKTTPTLQRVSDTTILQVVVTISLHNGGDSAASGSTDPARLTEQASADVVALHDALRGLAEFSKDVE